MLNKILLVILCVCFVLSMSACERDNSGSDSATSSDIVKDGESVASASQSTSFDADKDTTTVSSTKKPSSTAGKVSSTTKKSDVKNNAYDDIVCDRTVYYKQVIFTVQNSSAQVCMPFPRNWTLQKSKNGYSIIEESKTIGSIVLSEKKTHTNGTVDSEITAGNMKVTHSIARLGSDKEPSYTRTLCYNFDDEHKNTKNLILTVAYQEMDIFAVRKMMDEAEMSLFRTGKDWGVLPIQDNRNRILILGNSFVNSSQVGNILQAMCGSEVSVEAHSRGGINVTMYADDTNMMDSIRAGNYSVVFMCGFYTYNDALNLSKIIRVCEESNTKIAIFPAHNEKRAEINYASAMYPNVVLIDWKAEIDALVNAGIDYYEFCVADTYNHSKPLAGYVGAQMIYRAVFNKLPKTTSFNEVEKSKLDLLGKYVTTGSTIIDEGAYYAIG